MTLPKPKAEYKKKKCRTCGTLFLGYSLAQRYCSPKCASAVKQKKCRQCKKDFLGANYHAVFCSDECYRTNMSEKRKGKNNPAYRNGTYSFAGKDKNRMLRSQAMSKHNAACIKYRKSFVEKHGYPFCEVCNVNQNGTPKFEVHHIYFASHYPKHKELHNPQNLIHICIACHNKFHAGKVYEFEFRRIEKERGLKKLFKK